MCECSSSNDEKKKSQLIERELAKDRIRLEREIKILLLGAGESGKSTIAKQMRIIYLDGFGAEERAAFKNEIANNILSSMRILVNGAKKFGISLSAENQIPAEAILESENMKTFLITPSIAADLKKLWNDKGIQATFDRQKSSFMESLDRIGSSTYIPNEQDILRCRIKTTSIIETEFQVERYLFRLVDVGGQRNERRKWFQCFSGVTAVIFCVALSEYDLNLYEDDTMNRLQESLRLFDEVCNRGWFASTSIILFLNKSDLFKEKIKKSDLTKFFPEYKGGNNFEKACSFMRELFTVRNKHPNREIYVHITCATDTSNIKYVFSVVKDMLLKSTLVAIGLM